MNTISTWVYRRQVYIKNNLLMIHKYLLYECALLTHYRTKICLYLKCVEATVFDYYTQDKYFYSVKSLSDLYYQPSQIALINT